MIFGNGVKISPFGERIILSTNGARPTGYPHAKEWSWTPTLQRMQKKLTQIKDLNVRPKNIKLLEGNIVANLRDPLPIFNWVIYLFIIQLQEFFIYARYKSLFSA